MLNGLKNLQSDPDLDTCKTVSFQNIGSFRLHLHTSAYCSIDLKFGCEAYAGSGEENQTILNKSFPYPHWVTLVLGSVAIIVPLRKGLLDGVEFFCALKTTAISVTSCGILWTVKLIGLRGLPIGPVVQ